MQNTVSVVNTFRDRVELFSPTGTPLGQFDDPVGVALGGDGEGVRPRLRP